MGLLPEFRPDGRATDGRPTDGRPTDGRPTDGRPTDGRPTDAILHFQYLPCRPLKIGSSGRFVKRSGARISPCPCKCGS
jgi:hypothetical protein